MGNGGPNPQLKWYVMLVLSSGVMVACGGGEDGTGTPTPAPSFAEYATLDAQLHSRWDSEAATDPATLPGSGGATYQGVVNLDAQLGSSNLALSGALSLSADFGTSTISGSASAFRDQFEQSYSGALTVTNGVIDRAANPATQDTFSADLDGSLAGGGETLGVNADLSGDFLATGADATTGVISGLVTSSFGTGALFGDYLAAN